MEVYERLKECKLAGKVPLLDDLTPEELRIMYIVEEKTDYMISQLFDVKESKITYRRKKYGISIQNSIIDEYFLVKSERAKEMNNDIKEKLLIEENVSMISKAITHFAFRNGPIEEMHAIPNNQLSETDMKTLNKFMVNRIAYIITLILQERWIEFDFLIRQTDWMYGHGWDDAEPDDGGIRKLIEMMLKKRR
jgi:hypothetical protein